LSCGSIGRSIQPWRPRSLDLVRPAVDALATARRLPHLDRHHLEGARPIRSRNLNVRPIDLCNPSASFTVPCAPVRLSCPTGAPGLTHLDGGRRRVGGPDPPPAGAGPARFPRPRTACELRVSVGMKRPARMIPLNSVRAMSQGPCRPSPPGTAHQPCRSSASRHSPA